MHEKVALTKSQVWRAEATRTDRNFSKFRVIRLILLGFARVLQRYCWWVGGWVNGGKRGGCYKLCLFLP